MPNKDPNNWLLLSLVAALFGRLAWLGEKRAKGWKFWSWALLFELPVAFCMALIGHGIAEYFALGDMASLGLISALSYLGPRGLIVEVERFARIKQEEDKKDEKG